MPGKARDGSGLATHDALQVPGATQPLLAGWGCRNALPCSSTLRARRKPHKCLWLPACPLPAGRGLPSGMASTARLILHKQIEAGSPHPAVALSKPAGWQWQGPSLSHPADCPLSAPQERELLL